MPQLTFRAVLLAIVLAMILAAANAYLGLFAGLTIATAIPAAVVSMARAAPASAAAPSSKTTSCRPVASAAVTRRASSSPFPRWSSSATGTDFRYLWVLAIAGLGGMLGVLFSVPLRRTMIVEVRCRSRKARPAAEVLKAGENPAPRREDPRAMPAG